MERGKPSEQKLERCLFYYLPMTYQELEHRVESNKAIDRLMQNPAYAEKCKVAKHCFSGSDQILVNPQGHEFYPARQYWLDAGVSSEVVNTLLDKNGRWIYYESLWDLYEAMKKSPEECLKYLLSVAEPLYAPVQAFLDQSAKYQEHGFNDHKLETHVNVVTNESQRYLKEAGLNGRNVNLLQFASVFHDAGNAFSRSQHAFVVVEMLNRVFRTDLTKVEWLSPAITAILMHDEPVAYPFIESIYDEVHESYVGTVTDRRTGEPAQKKQHRKAETRESIRTFFETYRQEVHPATVALQMADKSHLSEDRAFNTRELTHEALINDKHFLINLLWSKECSHIYKDKGEFELVFRFNRLPNEAVRENAPRVLQPRGQHDGEKIAIPKTIKEQYRPDRYETHYFSQTLNMFWNIYYQRMYLYIIDTFALNPHVKRFVLRFKEYAEDGEVDRSQEYFFDRDTVFADLRIVQQESKFFPLILKPVRNSQSLVS